MRLGLPLVLIACSVAAVGAQSPSPSVPSPSAPTPGPASAAPSGSPPPYAAENERYTADVQRAIQGKEDLPSKEVFKNVQLFGDLPATRLLRTMQTFSRALGVSCTKCHVADHWDSEDKDEKHVTRDMVKMTRAINEDYLKQIKLLADDKPSVNCFTCHRGQAHPGAELRPAR